MMSAERLAPLCSSQPLRSHAVITEKHGASSAAQPRARLSQLSPPCAAALSSRGAAAGLSPCVAGRRRQVSAQAAAEAPPADAEVSEQPDFESLTSCRLENLLNTQGYIDPAVPEGTSASVFAVFDSNKKLQYIGFSKDLRNSLRTLFGRRPDKVFYHKSTHLPEMDQKQMLAVREGWFEEVGGPPIGNKLAMERAQWERPVDGGAISARGKLEAAKSQTQTQLAAMRTRGAVEEFIVDPNMLEQGKVDFLPSGPLDREAMEKERDRLAKIAELTRVCQTTVDDESREFKIFFRNSYKTNGGWMFDVQVTFDERETKHRVIIGEEYYGPLGLAPEVVIERVFSFLLTKKIPRHTEGMMLSDEFPVNYFAVSEVEQDLEGFQDMFPEGSLPGDGGYWRFNKIHDYGATTENSSFNTTSSSNQLTTWIDS